MPVSEPLGSEALMGGYLTHLSSLAGHFTPRGKENPKEVIDPAYNGKANEEQMWLRCGHQP